MTRQIDLLSNYQQKYLKRKQSEQKALERFALKSLRPKIIKTPNPIEIFEKKQQLKTAIRAQAAIDCRLSESILRKGFEPPIRYAYNIPIRYDYQRIRHFLESKRPLKYIYPGLKLPRSSTTYGMFTSSGQNTITCMFQVLRLIKKEAGLHIFDNAYWETLVFLKKHNFKFTEGKIKKNSKILYFDSSTHRKESPEILLNDLNNVELLIIDSTCFPFNSKDLEKIIKMAYSKGVVCLLIRSHMKLDCLGLEYGRLGSIAVIWNSKHSRSHKLSKSFLSAFQGAFQGMASLYGVPASTSQFYPFLTSKSFLKVNSEWLKTIQKNNRFVVDSLKEDPIFKNGPFQLTSFKHNFFFWISFRRQLTNRKMENLLAVLSRLLSYEHIMHKNIASYPWDFLGITNFNVESQHLSALSGLPTVRISMPDFDEETVARISLCFHLWLRKIRKNLK